MDQLTVSLDGLDHLIGENETTVCGIPVPMGSSQVAGTNQCPECFPKAEATEEAPKPKPKARAKKAK
jgi:hypothetical protein